MPRSLIIVCAFLTFYFNITFSPYVQMIFESSKHVRCDICASQAALSSSGSLASPAFSLLDVTSVEMENLDTSKKPQPIQPLAHTH